MRLPRRGGSATTPRRPAGGGSGGARAATPLVRLALLAFGAVVVLLLFGLLLQSCTSTSKHDSYKSYLDKVATIARSSQADGTGVASTLITPGAKPAQLATKLDGYVQQEQQNVSNAQHLDPPGPLRDLNERLVEALQLRVSGVQGLSQTLSSNPKSEATGEAAILAAQADRLLASDVVWDDLYRGPTMRVLQQQGVSGVAVPESTFVANSDLTSEHSMALLLTRLRGTATGGTVTGLHGTNIVETKVSPGGATLSTSETNTVVGGTSLAFVVSIADSGDSQEVSIKVTLTIQGSPHSIVKNQVLDLINPGQTKTVTFSNLGELPFGQKSSVSVDVAPVPGEHNTTNNKATYPVIFSLG